MVWLRNVYLKLTREMSSKWTQLVAYNACRMFESLRAPANACFLIIVSKIVLALGRLGEIQTLSAAKNLADEACHWTYVAAASGEYL